MDKNLAIIGNSYELLIGENYSHLFIGKNFQNNYVIGSFSREEDNKEIYYHTITSNKNLLDYFEKRISYYDLMSDKDSIIFQVTENYDTVNNILEYSMEIEHICFENIPDKFKPLEVSYYLVNIVPSCLKDLKMSNKEKFKTLVSETKSDAIDKLVWQKENETWLNILGKLLL